MSHTTPEILPEPVFLNIDDLAARLATTADGVRYLCRKRKISFIRIATNRKIRFWWPQVVEDLRRFEVNAIGRLD